MKSDNDKREQDFRWEHLTESQREDIRRSYYMLLEEFPYGAGVKGLQDRFGKHNLEK